MKILIVHDSVFGNTKQIAQAIGNAFGSKNNVKTIHVSDIKHEYLIGLGLLIVGSPTRCFKPTKAITNFLNTIASNDLKGVKVAAFDTRFSLSNIESSALRFVVKIGGYAAKSIAKRLKKKGGNLIISPEGFLVTGEKGPLKKGELERAANWTKLIMKIQ